MMSHSNVSPLSIQSLNLLAIIFGLCEWCVSPLSMLLRIEDIYCVFVAFETPNTNANCEIIRITTYQICE